MQFSFLFATFKLKLKKGLYRPREVEALEGLVMAKIIILSWIIFTLVITLTAAVPGDQDSDGIIDTIDNCLTIRNSGQLATLNEAEIQTFTVNGASYQVTLDYVNESRVRFTVDSQTTPLLQPDQFFLVLDHTHLVVREIMYQNYPGGIHQADFYIGGQLDSNDDGRGDACPNRAPSISVSNQVASVGQQLRFNLSLSDYDDDELQFYVDERPAGMEYVVSGQTTVTFTWTPTAEQVGQKSVTARVSDGELSDTESFTVTVTNLQTNQPAEQQRFDALQTRFNDLEDDFVVDKRNYERAVDRNDLRDVRDAKDDLNNVDEHLANLQDDVDDLSNDVEDSWNTNNRRDLLDDLDSLAKDIKHVRDRIDTLLHPDSTNNQEIVQQTYTPPSAPLVQSPLPKVVVEKLNFPASAAAVVEQAPVDSWEEVRPLVLLGAGIMVVLALMVFLIAIVMI